ncbi:MAG: biotin/lipoate--protein ligase family protein [Sulfitobacter sp.]
MIFGLELSFRPDSDDPGKTPCRTLLFSEGCAEVDAVKLLECWVKHSLVGINR